MKNKQLLCLLFVTSNLCCLAQGGWETLPVSSLGWRFEDMFFIDESKGWVAEGGGQILKTEDQGDSWNQQFYDSEIYFRSIEFLTEEIGFAGSLSSIDLSAQLYKTTDGGENWNNITANFPQDVQGICGMSSTSDNHLFITGTFYGFPYIMKSTDLGENWTYMDMSMYCNALVDVLFLNSNIGMAVGQATQNEGLKAVILRTEDAGQSWSQVAIGEENNQRSWKLQQLNENIVYASIEDFEFGDYNLQYFKSENGGQSWNLIEDTSGGTTGAVQGIGFLREGLGWLGGFSNLFYQISNDTEWTYLPTLGSNFNRFHKISDQVMMASGFNVYRYSDVTSEITELPSGKKAKGHELTAIYTESGELKVELELVTDTYADLSLYEMNGSQVKEIVKEMKTKGKHEVSLDKAKILSGNYLLVLYTYHGYQSIQVFVD